MDVFSGMAGIIARKGQLFVGRVSRGIFVLASGMGVIYKKT